MNLALAKSGDPEQAAARFAAAEREFRFVMEQSEIETTQLRARYFLAYSEYELGKYSEALEVIAPLITLLADKSTDAAYADAYVLEALCRLKLKEYRSRREKRRPRIWHRFRKGNSLRRLWGSVRGPLPTWETRPPPLLITRN